MRVLLPGIALLEFAANPGTRGGDGAGAAAPLPQHPNGPGPSTAANSRAAPSPERLRLSQRVVLHIYAQGRLLDGEVATPSFTQAGMSEKLGVGQSPLSNVLRRLVVGGVLTEDVRHVFGRPRRLRVYRLTAMGESLAVELRRRSGEGRPAGAPRGAMDHL